MLTASLIFAQEVPEFKEAKSLEINSMAEEAKPVFNASADKMFFVRSYEPKNVGYETVEHNEDVWSSTRNTSGGWSTPINETALNNVDNNAIIGQGAGDKFYLVNAYQDKSSLQYGISSSTLSGKQWSKPDVLPIPNLKYEGSFYDFHISSDEEVLLISIKGKDTKGQEDLYVSEFKKGKWTSPVNLGSAINTEGYEFSPFLSEDKQHLYFSTNGRKDGYGGADVYVSKRLDNSWTNWSTPVNLGSVINSDKMDCYFTMNSKNEYFFASDRNGATTLDIYQAIEGKPDPVYSENFKLVGTIRDTSTGKPMSVKMSIIDPQSDSLVAELTSDKKGNFEVPLKKGKQYELNVLQAKFHEYHVTYSTPALEDSIGQKQHDIWMNPYRAKDQIKLPPLYFVVGTDTLREESLPIVEKLNKILVENPEIKISIEGHTSSEGTTAYNDVLSESRAKRIKTILVDYGIKKTRLKTIGWGERHPKVKNLTEEDRRMNRRVEFIIQE